MLALIHANLAWLLARVRRGKLSLKTRI